MIGQCAAVRVQIHPLTHVNICKRVTGRKRERKAPVKNITVYLTGRSPDHVVSRSSVKVSIQFLDAPGAMLRLFANLKILFEAQDVAFPTPHRLPRHPPGRRAAAILHYARGTGSTREKRYRIE